MIPKPLALVLAIAVAGCTVLAQEGLGQRFHADGRGVALAAAGWPDVGRTSGHLEHPCPSAI